MDAGCDFRPVCSGSRADRLSFQTSSRMASHANFTTIGKRCPFARLVIAAMLAFAALMLAGWPVSAGNAPDLLPETSIAPADNGTAPARLPVSPGNSAPSGGDETETAAPAPRVVHHHAIPRPNATPIPNLVFEVEPAEARLLLRRDTEAYLQPNKLSPTIAQLSGGNFVNATGVTRFFVRIKLKSGAVAYVLDDDLVLTVPADKIFRLTADTPVLAQPNKWAKPIAEVHQGHDVHVIGVALSYMKIQMKSGLEGFIATRALE